MKKIYLVSILTLIASPLIANQDTYYQCDTEKGVVFSQFPCDKEAQPKTMKTYQPAVIKNQTEEDMAVLNRVDKEQRIRVYESQIKGTKTRIRTYKREKNVKYRQAELKLNKLMSEQERKELAKQVKQEQQHIEAAYKETVNKHEAELRRLQAELKVWRKKK